MKYGKKRSHSGAYENPNPEKRGKHGRKEMRNVTRTTRRGNHEEEGLEDKEHEEEEEQVEVSEDEQEEKSLLIFQQVQHTMHY